MPKKFTLLCHFNYYGRIWVILLEFKLACHCMCLYRSTLVCLFVNKVDS